MNVFQVRVSVNGKRFSEDTNSVEDDNQPGGLCTLIINENIVKVRETIQEECSCV